MSLHLSSDMPIDLHLHTTYSDGRWSAKQLLDYVAYEGFGLIAVTDHDRIDTVEQVQQLGRQKQVQVIAGVEVSAHFHGKMADILCFGFDPSGHTLDALTAGVRQCQQENAKQVYEELQHRGYRFARPQNLRVAGDCGRALMRVGIVPDWPSALALIIDAGYREIKVDLQQTVETVHRSGGVALIAHPGRGVKEPKEFTNYTPELLDQVRAEIPLDGIEVYYPTHSLAQVETYLAYAKHHNLLVSAGSDSHGPPGRLPIAYHAELCRHLLERIGIQV
jgi:predicted metal-dependent phosphoesterase TrpH